MSTPREKEVRRDIWKILMDCTSLELEEIRDYLHAWLTDDDVSVAQETGWSHEEADRTVTEALTPSQAKDDLMDIIDQVRQHRGAPAFQAPERTWQKPKETEWDLDEADKPVVVQACGRAGAPPVLLHPQAYAQIEALMDAYPSGEWLAYLIADQEGIIERLEIPEQDAGVAHVKVTTPLGAEVQIDGVIHSHHTMQVKHSSTDDDNLITNHPISIVVGRRTGQAIEFEAVRTTTVMCGAHYTQRVGVRVVYPDMGSWVDGVKANIKEPVSRSVYMGQGPPRTMYGMEDLYGAG